MVNTYKIGVKTFISIEFTFFVLSQLKMFSFLTGVASIFNLFILILFFVDNNFYIKNIFTSITFISLFFMGIIFEYNLIYNSYFQHHLIFLVTIFFITYKFKDEELLPFFNKLALIYFLLSIIFNYILVDLRLTVYDVRVLDHRFFTFCHRFIGLEGTPAGSDILFTILLILNIKEGIKSNIIYIIIYIVGLLWTSSLSNIVAVVLALPVFILPSFLNFIYLIMSTFLLHHIITYIYANFSSYRDILDIATTYRARIYYRIWEYSNFNFNYLFGNKELIKYLHSTGVIEEDPHSTYLLYEEKLGIAISWFIYIYLAIKTFFSSDRFKLFIISVILIYAATNSTILSPRGNPIIIFILLQYIVKIIDKNKGYYYVSKYSN